MLLHILHRLLLCSLLAAATPAIDVSHAAIAVKNAPVSVEQTWNPHPEGNDIILPMPCGLSMAFRTVAVPGGLVSDRRFSMGIGNADAERSIYERRFEAHIAAPFTPADLPTEWKTRLPANTTDGFTFYFLGKYEVSQHQWDAVMNGSCPREAASGAALPKRGISWFDVQDFLRKYNDWLIKNHRNSLPRFAGNDRNTAFLRLPTEEEWEFAARGGIRVSEEHRENNDIFPLEGRKLEDFGVFSSQIAIHEPFPIGSRKPNPLGLYDTVGNVKEMIDGFFRFSVADMRGEGEIYHRLHGAAGGILCKGGSFRSKEGEALPGWRDEVPLYTNDGESHPPDMGFRVAVASLNVPSGQRLQALHRANAGAPLPEDTKKNRKEAQKDAALRLNASGNPLTELDRITDVAATPEMRENLAQLRAMLVDQQNARERQQSDMLENSVRTLIFQSETMRSLAVRYFYLHRDYERHAEQKNREATQAIQKTLDEFHMGLLKVADYYKSVIQRVARRPNAETSRILAQLQQEYSGQEMLDEHMRQNIDNLDKHLAAVRNRGIDSLRREQICRDIIPQRHLKVIPLR